MPKRDSFAVRASRRRHENYKKACPICGQADPLLLTGDGRCTNCASRHKVERHHVLPKASRTTPEEELAVIPISLNAHRLVSDMQADHTAQPDSPTEPSYRLIEMLASMAEVILALEYLKEQPEMVRVLSVYCLMLFAILFVVNLPKIDLTKVLGNETQA